MPADTGAGSEDVGRALERAFASSLLPTEGYVVLAVSGGQDSLALLHAIMSARPGTVVVHALHVDHRLRPSSAEDARGVARLARSLGARAAVRRYDVASWVQKSGINAEAAARAVRYRLLADYAHSLKDAPVITGHTGDDLVESVLMHLLRGTGLEGLGGLQPRQTLPVSAFGPQPPRLGGVQGELTIVRPLLEIERWETAAYCARHGLDWVEDESNSDVSLTRNRIRHHLLPLLETYNPSVRSALRRLASLAREDGAILEMLAEEAWRGQAEIGERLVRFSRPKFLVTRPGIASRLVRRAAAHLADHATLSFEQVERCLSLAEKGSGSVQLSGDLEWRVSSVHVEIATAAPKHPRSSGR